VPRPDVLKWSITTRAVQVHDGSDLCLTFGGQVADQEGRRTGVKANWTGGL
jgi:hypothetical protein